MMQGKSNKAISRILDVAEPTVKHHVTAILKALKVTNRTEAVLAVGALNWKLPQVDERQIGSSWRMGAVGAAVLQELADNRAQRHGQDRFVQEVIAAARSLRGGAQERCRR